MKASAMLWIVAAGVFPVHAQNIIPPNISGTGIRGVGGGTGGGVEVNPEKPSETSARYITHIVLADRRQWTSTDGKPLIGKLIAFEDLTVEVPKGADPVAPAPPEHPTVVRDGKVRLAVDRKIFEVPLTRLSEEDRQFVEAIRQAHAPKPPPKPAGH
jgi:hypothetical protein